MTDEEMNGKSRPASPDYDIAYQHAPPPHPAAAEPTKLQLAGGEIEPRGPCPGDTVLLATTVICEESRCRRRTDASELQVGVTVPCPLLTETLAFLQMQ